MQTLRPLSAKAAVLIGFAVTGFVVLALLSGGTVEAILDNYREHIFDGIVMRTPAGEYRFVDAPEVKRTAERAVTLSITAAEAERLPPPEKGPGEFEVRRGAGKVARKFGFGWKKRR